MEKGKAKKGDEVLSASRYHEKIAMFLNRDRIEPTSFILPSEKQPTAVLLSPQKKNKKLFFYKINLAILIVLRPSVQPAHVAGPSISAAQRLGNTPLNSEETSQCGRWQADGETYPPNCTVQVVARPTVFLHHN